jgi:hypothetical protein
MVMTFLFLRGLNIFKEIPIALPPLMRMIPIPPSPGGVETAQMVSCSDMAVYYHKQGRGEKEIIGKGCKPARRRGQGYKIVGPTYHN